MVNKVLCVNIARCNYRYMHLTLHLGEGTGGQTFGWGQCCHNVIFVCVGALRAGALCPNTHKNNVMTRFKALSVDVVTTLKKARNLQIESTSK